MSRMNSVVLFALFTVGCNKKNECGGDTSLSFKVGEICHPCGAKWMCANEARPIWTPGFEDEMRNYLYCPEHGLLDTPDWVHEKLGRQSVNEKYVAPPVEAQAGQLCTISEKSGVCREGIWSCDDTWSDIICRPTQASQEICDGLDNDCDGEIDETLAPTDLQDQELQIVICRSCEDARGVSCFEQCGQVATESGFANECRGWCQSLASLMQCRAWWKQECADNDGDGFWDIECPSNPLSAIYGDCDDNDLGQFPGNGEVCSDGIDSNCDGNDNTGPCTGTCGAGVLECGSAEPLTSCSTSPGGSEYLPDHAFCSTCGKPVPNGTDPGTGVCIFEEGCDYPYDLVLSLVDPQRGDVDWEFCPGMEFCCNSIDDNGDGAVDEDCPSQEECYRRIPYYITERWCPGYNLAADRDSLLEDLRNWYTECAVQVESDPAVIYVLEHLDELVCRRALFRHLYWMAANVFGRENICAETDLADSAYLEGHWLQAVLRNPCENPADRKRFNALLIALLTHTSRASGNLVAMLEPEDACLYGDLGFSTCPVPDSREVCLAISGSYECDSVENPRVPALAQCAECGTTPWDECVSPFDRCDLLITDGEYCEYGCNIATNTCDPCGCLGATCGSDNCGNFCGECEYYERCDNAGPSVSECEPAELVCEGWAFSSSDSWIDLEGTRTISVPIAPESDWICLDFIPSSVRITHIDGIPGSDVCSFLERSIYGTCPRWAEVTRTVPCWVADCYDLRDSGLLGLIADSVLVFTARSASNSGCPSTDRDLGACYMGSCGTASVRLPCDCATSRCSGDMCEGAGIFAESWYWGSLCQPDDPPCRCNCANLTGLNVRSCRYE